MARVVLENVSKTFPAGKGELIRALKNVSFSAEDRELLALVGPSGSGKSTLLRLIAGLETPSSGTISIDSTVMNDVRPADRDVAMVFQNSALYPHLTVYENLAFPLRLRKVSQKETARRVHEAASLLGLTDCFDRLPPSLSGGERQRVALGRAIVRRPKVFLLDEPLSNLDATLRAELRTEIAALHRHLGATMIYVTHDQIEAMTLGDRVAVLGDGSIQQIDQPPVLYRAPSNLFVARFIGWPAMNLWRGRLGNSNGRCGFQSIPPGRPGEPSPEKPIAPVGPAAEAEAASSRMRKGSNGDRVDTRDVFSGEGRPFILPLPDEVGARLAAANAKDLILGLRPEQLTLQNPASCDAVSGCPAARVRRVEATGPETYVQVDIGGQLWIVRGPADSGLQVGADVRVTFNVRDAHFFDSGSGRRL